MSAGLFATLIAAAIVLGGAAILAVLYLVLTARQSASIQRRLLPGGPEPGEFDGGGGDLLKAIASKGKQVEKLVDTNNESQRLLLQAGWRANHHRVAYYASQILVPLVLLGLVLLLWMFGPEKLKGPLIFLGGAFAVMLGLLVPRMILRSRAEARVRRMKSEVPLFIHLLVLLFEAGLSTRQAFASLVRDGSGVLPELGKEFDLVLRQLEAGGDTAEVLQHLSKAMDLEDLTSVLALLRQVDKYGGEVRDPLLETLKVIEERRSLDMREMVNLISGRMTVVMVLFFFPALLIFTGGPAALSIVRALTAAAGR